jgi:CheY-like chemotaxis protein
LSGSIRTNASFSRSIRTSAAPNPVVEFDSRNRSTLAPSDACEVSGPGTEVLLNTNENNVPADEELPEVLSVLFVDDNMVLRKLFARSVKNNMPKWNIKEAASGETALQIAKEHHFDLIFVDQYMASVEKQLLGTETTRALRAQGVSATIFGLSANDVEKAFLEAGADGFMLKPFPCKPDLLKIAILRILEAGKASGRVTTTTSCSAAGRVQMLKV